MSLEEQDQLDRYFAGTKGQLFWTDFVDGGTGQLIDISAATEPAIIFRTPTSLKIEKSAVIGTKGSLGLVTDPNSAEYSRSSIAFTNSDAALFDVQGYWSFTFRCLLNTELLQPPYEVGFWVVR